MAVGACEVARERPAQAEAPAAAPAAPTTLLGGKFKAGTVSVPERLTGLLGIVTALGIAFLLSNNRRRISLRTVVFGLGLQLVLALIVLNPTVGEYFFSSVDRGIKALLGFAEKGFDFLFQAVEMHKVEHSPTNDPGAFQTTVVLGHISPVLKNLAFWVLPTIIFFSALMTLLYHLGIMQLIVKGFAWLMQKTLCTSGAETLSASANIFLGQTEAPLLVRPFVARMTQSELMCVMVGGFATVAGGVMAVYVGVLKNIPGIAGHLMIASIMNAPAALVLAKIVFPETEVSETSGTLKLHVERPDANSIEAIARGASEGLSLVLNVAAMLIAFVAMLAVADALLSWIGSWFDFPLSLTRIFGWIFTPFAWTMGIPWDEAGTAGTLLGEKIVLTELISYIHLGEIVNQQGTLSVRSAQILAYALCGFANVASIGIQIGGIGGMAPSRRGDIARLGLKAMFVGFLASMLSGTIAGLLI